MSNISKKHINNYANSMFRLENLNPNWITSCVNYLTFLFGENYFQNKVVVDYAFGRGNWSLALLKLGAKKVYAIDASEDNCVRFKKYCDSHNIEGIEIINANILEDNLDIKCDFIWLYGILHHIKEIDSFLSKLVNLLKSKESQIYVYYYNKNSARELLVNICRSLYTYEHEIDFISDSFLFLNVSKNRASDDLTAPYIGWYTAEELKNKLLEHGLFVHRKDIDFYEYQNKRPNVEFYPHQFLCSPKNDTLIEIKEESIVLRSEFDIITLFCNELSKSLNKDNKKKLCIGLFNMYFSTFMNNQNLNNLMINCFLYIVRCILISIDYKNNKILKEWMLLVEDSIKDMGREKYKASLGQNIFTEYLCSNKIRL